MSGREFAVAGRRIGPGAPVFVVAEAGVNHNGERALARRLVDAAAEAGADAVKFQTFSTEALVSRDAPKANYQREATGEAGSQGEMLARLELDAGAHREIRDRCAERGLVFFSTPFDAASADLLERLGVPCFKLGSGELTNLPFLRHVHIHVGAKGKPVIVSTGMSTLDEVAQAVAALREAGEAPLALLHCLSAYPAPAAEMNLRAMDTLSQRFGCPVGLSDHTSGIEIAVAAVARGAAMPAEADTRRVARKSLVAARAITAGQRLAAADVAIKRPGTGISPADLPRALGRVVRRDVAPDEVIGWETLGEP
ncbi:MAG: N-acetylneuraminate synthase family protein [Candidatus Rokubacteria bacterium]|nr:N-acetylneuraminate synthase family protein [Candidatus Rokubacteria bacterium]